MVSLNSKIKHYLCKLLVSVGRHTVNETRPNQTSPADLSTEESYSGARLYATTQLALWFPHGYDTEPRIDHGLQRLTRVPSLKSIPKLSNN